VTVLERYHAFTAVFLPQGRLFLKPGMRGFPQPPPAERVFRGMVAGDARPLVDASGTGGAVALEALASGAHGTTVFEPSMAALRCARLTHAETGASVDAGLPWELAPASMARLALAPPADRGNSRVVAELVAAARVLLPDGILYLAVHKDQGGRRYQKHLATLFAETTVTARDKGWRLIEARIPLPGEAAPGGSATVAATTRPGDRSSSGPVAGASSPWSGFDAAGLPLESLPGVHSAGKLDPGTSVLASVAPWTRLEGKRVLDLGCGVGLLALLAARSGARVVAVDDDWAAVVTTRHNAQRLGLGVQVLHSDVDSALGGEQDGSFDAVLCNPPFHVGRGVRLEVPEAFMAASWRLLRPGGELWLVANRDLPYERMLSAWAGLDRAADERGFKVLRAPR
jgi:16S rRNA (guanine1207-N2)-methyltransferase